jgi:hypothetical protein
MRVRELEIWKKEKEMRQIEKEATAKEISARLQEEELARKVEKFHVEYAKLELSIAGREEE